MIKEEKKEFRRRILGNRDALPQKERQAWDERILEHLVKYDEEKPREIYLCYVNYKSEVDTKEFIRWCLQKEKAVFVPKVLTSDMISEDMIIEDIVIKDIAIEDITIEESALCKRKKKATGMEFYRIFRFEDLKAGYQGILEPEDLRENSLCSWIEKMQGHYEYRQEEMRDSLAHESTGEGLLIRMLMPGAVFDKMGNRIGYGGGFYDKWLAKWSKLWENEKCGGAGTLEKVGLAYQMQIMEEIPTEPFDQKADFVVTEDGMSGHSL